MLSLQTLGIIHTASTVSVRALKMMIGYSSFPGVGHSEGVRFQGLGSGHWNATARIEKIAQIITAKDIPKLARKDWGIIRSESRIIDAFAKRQAAISRNCAAYNNL
jgi:hypothetical protein